MGHDLGGGVARIAAVRAPDRFSGLVLTNAVCYDSWPIPSVEPMRSAARVPRHAPESMLHPSFVQLAQRGHGDRARALRSLGVHWRHYLTRLTADLGTVLQPIPGGRHSTPEDHPEVIGAAVDELLAPAATGTAAAGRRDTSGK